ncbi:AAA family ATPase [Bacillus sp. ISL-47]|uniref:P-loop NTPase fold protein n=1 Tax=Bacillus sp. ISL-47 TaxID=2819130 RepID=UPI001BEC6FA6|nr:P-loop NTPase fold protein [Bacillus sp. ISL-47]MBT2689235.1 AAA family ATPase [Bacillus sp. ISL-47]MBT2708643.1 AAA family ATPase [Pseudomonas sp. ISL-84]
MKILVNHSKLHGVPFHKDVHNEMFYFEKDKVEQIKNEVLCGDGSSILISGYRGAGKTSFINKVEEQITNEPNKKKQIHFVKLNLTKFNGYPYLIRKIIRAVYESIPAEDLKDLSKKDPDLATKLGLLYERTFNDVTAINNFELSNQTKSTLKSTFNAKKLTILFFSIIVTALNLIFDFSQFLLNKEVFSKIINWITFIGVSIWGAVEAFKFDLSWSKEQINKHVLNRQSLYDEEIAEHRLTEILKELNEKDIKFVIVLDELDKIDILGVENIISELKFLMLSGLASFIIIAGQQLYYKYDHSPVEDDSILSSLFSNIIHIPLSDAETFKKIAGEIITDKDTLVNDTVSNYISALTLISNRLPRRFINLLRQEIKWDGNNNPYLEITDQDEKNIVLARCLEVIEKIESNELEESYDKYSDGIKDFFSFQLHRWLQIIIKKRDVPFTLEDIMGTDQNDLPPYLSRYTTLLTDLAELLKDRLLEANVLSQITQPAGEESDKYLFTYEITIQENHQNPNSYNSKFINNINNIKQLINHLSHYMNSIEVTDSMEDKVKKLVENQYLSQNWTKNIKRLNSLQLISEKLSSNISLSAEEVNILQESNIQSSRFESELLESYYYYLTRRVFEHSNYKVTKYYSISSTKKNRFYADFFMLNSQETKPDILFEVKLSLRSMNTSIYSRLIDNLREYNQLSKKENYLVIIINESNMELDRIYQRLSNTIKDPEIMKYVKVYIAQDYSPESFKAFINENIN